jgi:hypothetical protein
MLLRTLMLGLVRGLRVFHVIQPTGQTFRQETESRGAAQEIGNAKDSPTIKARRQPEQVKITGSEGELIICPPDCDGPPERQRRRSRLPF